MKIVFICNEYPPVKAGGIGIFTKKLAEGLAKAGHDIYVVGIYWGIKSRIEETTNQVKVVRIPHSTGRFSLISNRIAIYENLKYISSVKQIDILETPDFEANTAYIPKLAKINITRLHGSHTYFSSERSVKPSTIIRHLEKRQLKLSSSIVSVSQYTAKETKRLFSLRDNPHVIYNSVDIDSFKKQIKNDYIINKRAVYFGSLAEKKGIYPLVEAWRIFILNNSDWTLTIIGKEAYENGVSNKTKMIEVLGDTKYSVKFIEHMDNEKLISSLRNYDFAILPSFSEAFALAPLEAMAIGLPVIISSLSSGPELVNDGIDGWLCDPREPNTLLNAMNKAAESEIKRESIARAAKRKIKDKFDFNKFIKENIVFYEKQL